MYIPSLTLSLDTQEFIWRTGVHFEGLTLSMRGDGWQLTLRGRNDRGHPVYCTAFLENLYEDVVRFDELLQKDGGRKIWHADKFRE